jgi:xylan 1,4-beta-xylosidase
MKHMQDMGTAKKNIILSSLAVIFLSGCRHFPEACHHLEADTITYINPVIKSFNPDPSVCRVGEDYYLVTSTFEYFPGVPVYQSRDLVHWKQVGYCLTRKSQLNLKGAGFWGGIYAPTIRYHDGIFYMITTNVGGGGNFFVTARDPSGTWSDPVWIDDSNFDPSLFFDDDGKVYYTRRSPTGIVQAEIDINTGKFLSELQEITRGMVSRDAEGPHLYKINGWYYIMLAEGGTRALHMETIGRSRSPWGPFIPCPNNPILAQHEGWGNIIRGPGHAEIIQAHDGSWWMIFLATRHNSYDAMSHLGRESFLVPVNWEKGWPVIDNNNLLSLEMKARTLPPHPWEQQKTRDEFYNDSLDLCWIFLCNPLNDSWSLFERPGFLRLYGQKATLDSIGSPAFVGRKQTSFHFKAETMMEFNPSGENQEAGLTTYLNDKHHYDFFVAMRNRSRCLFVRKTIGDIVCEVTKVKLEAGSVILRIIADPEKYQFQFSTGQAKEYTTVATGLTQYLGTELANTWTGVVIAMYATGNGKKSAQPADFGWFDFQKPVGLN